MTAYKIDKSDELEKFVIANWKMNGCRKEWRALSRSVQQGVQGVQGAKVVLCPPQIAMADVQEQIGEGHGIVSLGAQDISPIESGAYTGDVSASMLKDFFVKYTLVGHSERRNNHGESDREISAKMRQALRHEIVPVLCIGESMEEREEGKSIHRLDQQLLDGLEDVFIQIPEQIMIAYEPVWAISSSKGDRSGPTEQELKEVFRFIRSALVGKYGEVGESIYLLYGGSVKPETVSDIMKVDGVSGVLVGAASLNSEVFTDIVEKVAQV